MATPTPPKPAKKQLILNAFVMNTPGHLSAGLWNHPRNHTDQYFQLPFWISLAKLLDDAGFHAMFIADTLGPYDVYKGPANVVPVLGPGAQFPVNDPLFLVPSMAAATKNIIFGVTSSTTYEHPYALARRFSTVDHLANGRVGWNIVTSYLDSAARNFGFKEQIPHDERYARADEYMDVVYKLWEGSFRDDAVVRDRAAGVYTVKDGVRPINHNGKYYSCAGPHFCEPSPQRTPFLFQAGVSKAGNNFGAKHSETIFVGGITTESVRESVDTIRAIAKEKGRDPLSIRVMLGLAIIVAETDEAAQAKKEEYLSYGDREGALALFGGWTGIDMSTYSDDEDFRFSENVPVRSMVRRWSSSVPGTDNLPWTKNRIIDFLILGGFQAIVVGSPKTVVDQIEEWADNTGLDGFNLAHIVNPGSFEDIIEFVLPELRRRGLFREKAEKEGVTAREVFNGQKRLAEDHPGSKFKWRAGEEIPAYQRQ